MKLKKEKKPSGAAAKIPVSRNPSVAYKQGYERGLEEKRSNETICGFEFMQCLLMITMYNANDDLGYLSLPRLSDFYDAVQAELTRIKNDVISPDEGITNEDKILLLDSWTETVQKKLDEAVARRENRRIKNDNQNHA